MAKSKSPKKKVKNTKGQAKATAAQQAKSIPSKTNPANIVDPQISTSKAKVKFVDTDIDDLCFILTNNKISVTNQYQNIEQSPYHRKIPIPELLNDTDEPYSPTRLYFSKAEIIDILKRLTENHLSENAIKALKNIGHQLLGYHTAIGLNDGISIEAIFNSLMKEKLTEKDAEIFDAIFRPINCTENSFDREQLIKIIMIYSSIEPSNIIFVNVVSESLFVLLKNNKLESFDKTEIFRLTNYAIRAARPITGPFSILIATLTKHILDTYNPSDLGPSEIPILLKSINFLETCKANLPVNLEFGNFTKKYKKKLIKRANNLLKSEPQYSSDEHVNFSKLLKTILKGTNFTVEDEYFCPLVGTHLDIAIPNQKIAIEINGPTHYNADQTTEESKTRYKKELLEACGWYVVSVPVWDICNTIYKIEEDSIEFRFSNTKAKQIINNKITPYLLGELPKSSNTLLKNTDPRFFILPKKEYGDKPNADLASDYDEKYEKVTNFREGIDRVNKIESAEKNYKPTSKCLIDNKTSLTLNLTDTPAEKTDDALKAFGLFCRTQGRFAVKSNGELDRNNKALPPHGNQKREILSAYMKLKATKANIIKSENNNEELKTTGIRFMGNYRKIIYKDSNTKSKNNNHFKR